MMRKNKAPSQPAAESSHQHSGGNFGVGFFLGLIGGTVGMFLLGTKQGHEVLRSLRQEMETKADEALEPETKQKLLTAAQTVKKATKQAATEWQDKFPKFQRKDLSS